MSPLACKIIAPGMPRGAILSVPMIMGSIRAIIDPCSLMMLTLPPLPVGINPGVPPTKLSIQGEALEQLIEISPFALRVMSPEPLGAKEAILPVRLKLPPALTLISPPLQLTELTIARSSTVEIFPPAVKDISPALP